MKGVRRIEPVRLRGRVGAADADRGLFVLNLPDGRKVRGSLEPRFESVLIDALRDRSRCGVVVEGDGEVSDADGTILRLVRIGNVSKDPDPGEDVPAGEPFWRTLERLGAEAPPEVWEDVPPDLSTNLDGYLYGGAERRS